MANAQDYIVVNSKTRKRIAIGDKVAGFRGETYILSGFQPPRHAGSTGRVDLRNPQDEYVGEFFPSVIDAVIVRR